MQQTNIFIDPDDVDTGKIVRYKRPMLDEMLQLFYNTVHTVNAKDYNNEQLATWAPVVIDKLKWEKRLEDNFCLVAVCNEQIVGFGELSAEGGIDTMFVHEDFQGQKIASRILAELMNYALEQHFNVLTTDASITAKPFFESHGFKVVKKQKNSYNNLVFVNYNMQKNLSE